MQNIDQYHIIFQHIPQGKGRRNDTSTHYTGMWSAPLIRDLQLQVQGTSLTSRFIENHFRSKQSVPHFSFAQKKNDKGKIST